ncbi:hypothetical protein BDN72DRAFT_956865 [Pluteus cervinus]|uniref:Uncharacterized protein n=1 Tax=Pluteus cervinus TaxID=181527 RepID=A0ACD3B609_9AGAR|nr:hypothetical protein BDN72DRAFT_956865 [Pluteus cervinus]
MSILQHFSSFYGASKGQKLDPKSSTVNQISLSDLPAEILECIYSELDAPTLYVLSQLSRHLHHTALPRYFLEMGFASQISEGSLELFEYPRQMLLALQGALYLNNLEHYSIRLLEHSDIQGFYSDLRIIQRIIRNNTKCSSLELELLHLDRLIATSGTPTPYFRSNKPELPVFTENSLTGKRTRWNQKVRIDQWRDTFLGTLEEAVRKGCKELHLSRGALVVDAYCNDKGKWIEDLEGLEGTPEQPQNALEQDDPKNPVSRLLDALIRRRELPTIFQLPSRPVIAIPNNQLWSVNLCGSLLLHPPLRAWTVHLFNTSPSLTSLSLDNQAILPELWTDILPTIRIPSLSHLVLQDVNIPYPALSLFLARHADRLKRMTMRLADYHFHLPRHRIRKSVEPHEIDKEWKGTEGEFTASMPVLEEVSMSSAYLIWFFNQPRIISIEVSMSTQPYKPPVESSTSSSLASRFPRLREIGVITDPYKAGQRPLSSTYVDLSTISLLAVVAFITSFSTHNIPSPLETLILRTSNVSQFRQFIWKHMGDPGFHAPLFGMVIRQMKGVKTVKFGAMYEASFVRGIDRETELAQEKSRLFSLYGRTEDQAQRDRQNEWLVDSFEPFSKKFPDVKVVEVIEQKDRVDLERLVMKCGGTVTHGLRWVKEVR